MAVLVLRRRFPELPKRKESAPPRTVLPFHKVARGTEFVFHSAAAKARFPGTYVKTSTDNADFVDPPAPSLDWYDALHVLPFTPVEILGG